MKTILSLFVVAGLGVFGAQAQDQAPPPMPNYESFTTAQLDQLLGPIALYPDPLISIILPASTFPTEIVEADRYVSGGGDPNEVDQQPWDPSVQALAHYPDILKWMDDNVNWTTQVGEAFQNQQQDVMDAIQGLRLQAYNLGNLQSTPQLQVVNDNGYIEILPANPDQVPVPQYQPDQVYYQSPYGTPFITYTASYPIGAWLCFDFDWGNHRMIYWDHNHPRPANWWRERPADHDNYFRSQATVNVWRPQSRAVYNNQSDRGWNTAPRGNQPAPNQYRQPDQRTSVPEVNRPAPASAAPQRYDSAPQNNAFIGGQNTRDVQTESDRGYHSIEATHPSSWYHTEAPPTGGRSAPSFHSGGSAPSGGNRGGSSPQSGGRR